MYTDRMMISIVISYIVIGILNTVYSIINALEVGEGEGEGEGEGGDIDIV